MSSCKRIAGHGNKIFHIFILLIRSRVFKHNTLKYLIAITLALSLDFASAQPVATGYSVPSVFLIGEYEDQYFALTKAHPAIFMSAYNNDIDKAFRGWSNMIMDIEDYAGRVQFDLKGVKLWLNLYFNSDGTIRHLAFYPKPNSRNMPVDDLADFFKDFIAQYRLPVKSQKAFHHSASAGFPSHFYKNLQETAFRGR